MQQNKEIERRFLLKRKPHLKWSHIYEITQYYIKHGEMIKRFRVCTDVINDKKTTYEYLHKVPLNKGEFMEVHEDYEIDQIPDIINRAFRFTSKTRYVYEENGLKFEFDEIDNVKLLLLEIELEAIDQDLTIPALIQEQIIAEITGMKGFSNFDLAKPIYK